MLILLKNLQQNATESAGVQAEITNRTNFFSTVRVCEILFPILKSKARFDDLLNTIVQSLFITTFNIFYLEWFIYRVWFRYSVLPNLSRIFNQVLETLKRLKM